ncbi:hypothetical protein GCM10023147_47740 [Tsukamurella soli]|uniref:DinB-like domain-containing protein n=1 Tax=Tsukamurella soli TaxID=644556 RepID=A0ABP8KEI5_9ACTN
MTSPDPLLDAFDTVTAEVFDAIAVVLERCDDHTVNAVPDAPGVNSVFALVTHIDGMIGYWGGSFAAGEAIPRDRDAEFRARGTVEQARELLLRARTRLPGWAAAARTDGIRGRAATGTTRRDTATATPEFVLLHILRELAQHAGHLQICADLVIRGR